MGYPYDPDEASTPKGKVFKVCKVGSHCQITGRLYAYHHDTDAYFWGEVYSVKLLSK
jgi:hypothetical protein